MPELSIIVPVYNVEAYLKLCISSILNQPYQDYEAILIDDGSSDSSGVICDEFSHNDKRIKVFHKENSGVSATRNLGIDKACGKWITFVDADDELLPDALNKLMNYAKGGYDLIELSHYMVKDNQILTPKRANESKIISKKEFYTLFFNYPWYAYHGYVYAKIYRKDILNKNKIRFVEDIYYKEDGLFICQYVAHCKNILISTEPVYKYNIRENSAVSTYNKQLDKKSFSHIIASTSIYKIIKQQNLGNELNIAAKNRICYSYNILKSAYKKSQTKDYELLKKTEIIFKENASNTFYLKYSFIEKLHKLKRQIYLILKFLRIKK